MNTFLKIMIVLIYDMSNLDTKKKKSFQNNGFENESIYSPDY